MNTQMKKLLILGALAASMAGMAVACGSSSTGTTHIDGSGDGDSGTPGGDGDSGTPGGDGDSSMPGGDGDTGTPSGDGDSGTPSDCFTGTPKTMEDFLNRCTDATTTAKDPVIPLANKDGTVKPINGISL